MSESWADDLIDLCAGSKIRYWMTALLRRSVYSGLAGYEDVNDAERQALDA